MAAHRPPRNPAPVDPASGAVVLPTEGGYGAMRLFAALYPRLNSALTILSRILLGFLGLFAFLFGIQLLRVVAAAVGPFLQASVLPLTQQPWQALAFGWLAAYAILSGSPVAAFSLVLFDSNLIREETTYFMIMGSRLGATFIVLLIGVVALARGQPREKSLAMGVLSFLVTYSIYLPAILLGWVLLRLGALTWFQIETPQFLLDYLDRILQPVLSVVLASVPAVVAFIGALVLIYVGLALTDKAFGRRQERELKSPRMQRYLRHPAMAFAIGALVTLASTSVSLSLALLVPLYLGGHIERRTIVPYIMGANITTFIDTLIAALALGGGIAANLVVLEMATVTAFSIVALVKYRRYSDGIDAVYRFIFHRNWALGGFIALLFVVPILLLLFR